MRPPSQTWTARDLLAWMSKAFEAAKLDSPRPMSDWFGGK